METDNTNTTDTAVATTATATATDTAVATTATQAVALPTNQAPKSLAGKLAGGNRFLRRVQLYSGRSAAVSAGDIGVNQWGSPGSKGQPIIPLGEKVDAYILSWRGKAIDFTDLENIEQVYAFNDEQYESEAFQRIVKEAGVKDSEASFGVEFLIAIEKVGLVSYFANSATARSEAEKLFAFLPVDGQGVADLTPVTFGSENIVSKKFTWRGPTFQKSSTPFTMDIDGATVAAAIKRFMDPPAQREEAAAEPVSDAEASAVGRER